MNSRSPPFTAHRDLKLCVSVAFGDVGKAQLRLEETDGLAHRRLQVERLDVLPVLLKQRDEEVDAC
jgi:hypothetical protein